MNIKGKNFLVIGGAGLIGSHLVDRLLQEDINQITIFDNFTRGSYENIKNALKDHRVKIFEFGGDILQQDILNKAMLNQDGVFHFAALWLLHCHDFPESAFEVNVRGSFNVMHACIKNNIKKLIYSSSASVYGDALTEPMTEDHPFNNKNFYGATKIASEALMRAYYHRFNLNFIGLRYMNVYGPRQDYQGAYIAVIMKMIDSISNNINPVIYGDGSESFDFVSVKDCANANICAMKSEISNEFYNVGTGIKTSLLDLAKTLLKLMDSKLEIKFETSSEKTLVKNRVGDVAKAKKDINYSYSQNLEEGLNELLKWRKLI